MTRRFLVTGGAGFIGSAFVRRLLHTRPEARVTNLDALTYAGVPATVDELNDLDGHTFVHGDVRDADLVSRLVADHDVIVHFAAESHVDRSIVEPAEFLSTNVGGTGMLLDAAVTHGIDLFVHVGTDEVYGPLPEGFASEDAPLAPSSPYSASKAAADLLVGSYVTTYDLPAIVTRCTNNYGPYQFPEKLIPLFITNLLDDAPVPLYGDGRNERDWLFVDDHCDALLLLLDNGAAGHTYNIGAGSPLSNLAVTRAILGVMGRGEDWIRPVEDRPGHDLRYAVDSSKIRSLGWKPAHHFEAGLADTIAWYADRQDWWRPLKAVRR